MATATGESAAGASIDKKVQGVHIGGHPGEGTKAFVEPVQRGTSKQHPMHHQSDDSAHGAHVQEEHAPVTPERQRPTTGSAGGASPDDSEAHPTYAEITKHDAHPLSRGAEATGATKSAMQRHVAFFDKDGDGVVWPCDTISGFRRIGVNVVFAFFAAVVLHLCYGFATSPTWIPSMFFPIYLDRIHRAKRDSDTDTFDAEGRFQQNKFDDIFKLYDRDGKGGLSGAEVRRLVREHTLLRDPVGSSLSAAAWSTLWWLARDERGVLTKESVRAVYDGTIFEKLATRAKEREAAAREGQKQRGEKEEASTKKKEE